MVTSIEGALIEDRVCDFDRLRWLDVEHGPAPRLRAPHQPLGNCGSANTINPGSSLCGTSKVDEYLETSVPGVYAMGDVKGGPAFTHLSYDEYRILHANLITDEKASTRDRIVPYTAFIDPQLGRAGMTEREARAQGREIRVAKLPMSAVVRAIETGETRGFMKAVVDADTGQTGLRCARQ